MSVAWAGLAAVALLWWLHSRVLQRDAKEKEYALESLNTEILKLEKRLAVRRHRFDDLLEAVEEAVLRVNRSGHVLSANAKAMQLFSMARDTQFPKAMVSWYREPDWLDAFNVAVKALPDVVELPEIFFDEQVFLPRLAGLGSDQGLLLCLNITEQYRLQEQRKNFVSNLMHDLKTPLTSLLGYARSIESFGDDEALRNEAASVIAHEAKHVNELLDALLSIEQIEHGQGLAASCDAVAVCKNVWQAMQPEMFAKGVQLSLHLPEKLEVAMREVDCFRVLMNVASNAVHYTHEDTTVHCCVIDMDICIEDEGDGIPEKDLPHVTERFYRVDAVRSRGGHGLGLAIVKEMLDRDGGHLILRNRDNDAGLQVFIGLPLMLD